jgi:hypothetical protein
VIQITVSNRNGPHRLIARVKNESIPAASEAAAEYLLGNEQRGLRHLVPYKYVSRKKAYGKSFFTDKQRRWFWANVRDGTIAFPIHYQRTGTISSGWKTEGRGLVVKVVNRARGVGFVLGDKTQARQPAMVGHRKISEVIASNFAGMIRAAQQAVNRILKGRA